MVVVLLLLLFAAIVVVDAAAVFDAFVSYHDMRFSFVVCLDFERTSLSQISHIVFIVLN